jgi:hypothetical protein
VGLCRNRYFIGTSNFRRAGCEKPVGFLTQRGLLEALLDFMRSSKGLEGIADSLVVGVTDQQNDEKDEVKSTESIHESISFKRLCHRNIIAPNFRATTWEKSRTCLGENRTDDVEKRGKVKKERVSPEEGISINYCLRDLPTTQST